MTRLSKWAVSTAVATALCGAGQLARANACDTSTDPGIAKAEAALKAAEENLTKAKADAAKAAEEKAAHEKAEKEKAEKLKVEQEKAAKAEQEKQALAKAEKEKAAREAQAKASAETPKTTEKHHHHDEAPAAAAASPAASQSEGRAVAELSAKLDAVIEKLSHISQKIDSLGATATQAAQTARDDSQKIEAVAAHDTERAHRYQAADQSQLEAIAKRLASLEALVNAADQKATAAAKAADTAAKAADSASKHADSAAKLATDAAAQGAKKHHAE